MDIRPGRFIDEWAYKSVQKPSSGGVAVDAGSEGSQSFGTALGVVEGEVGEFGNGHTVAVVEDVSRIAFSAGSVGVSVSAEGVAQLTSSLVQNVSIEAGSAAAG
jgi:hypothetical protein